MPIRHSPLARDLGFACVIAIVAGILSRDSLNPDGVAYLENAELMARGHLGAALQGYWSPGLSAILAPFFWFAGTDRPLVLYAAHMQLCLTALTALVLAAFIVNRDVADDAKRLAFWSLAWVIIIWDDQWLLTPDLLLSTLALAFVALLPARTLRTQVAAGLVAGLAFFVKTSAWPFLAVGTVLLALKSRRDRTPFPFAGVATALAIALTFIVPLSVREGSPTLGSVGPLNMQWYLGDVSRQAPDGGAGPADAQRQLTIPALATRMYYDYRPTNVSAIGPRTYLPWSDPEGWQRRFPPGTATWFSSRQAMKTWTMNAKFFGAWFVPVLMLAAIGLGFGAAGATLSPRALILERPLLVASLAYAATFLLIRPEPRHLAPAALLCLIGGFMAPSSRPATTGRRRIHAGALAALAVSAAWFFISLFRLHQATSGPTLFAETLDAARERSGTGDVAIVGGASPWMGTLWAHHMQVAVQLDPYELPRAEGVVDEMRHALIRANFRDNFAGIGERVGSLYVARLKFIPW